MGRLRDKFKAIGVVLLASGFSKRMGVNKLLMPLGQPPRPCIRIVAETLIQSGVGQMIVVYQDEAIPMILSDLGLIFIKNEKPEKGQSEAVKLGAAYPWEAHIKGLAFAVADQPLLRAEDYQRIFSEFLREEANIALPCVGEESFSPAVFHILWRDVFMKLEGDVGGKALFKHKDAMICKVFFNRRDIFMDMDTPEDYKTLRELMNTPETWRD